jgi:purine-binding chemotaxis protein CheW
VYLVEFSIEDQIKALAADAVESVFAAVAMTPLADAPPAVAGLVNIHGNILPVVSLRRHLGLPDRELRPSDRMLLVHGKTRAVVLLVDAVAGVLFVDDDRFVARKTLFPAEKNEGGVVLRDGDMILVDDLERMLGARVGDAVFDMP